MKPSKSAAYNEEISRVINHRDELKNSPLHYATQQWDQVRCIYTVNTLQTCLPSEGVETRNSEKNKDRIPIRGEEEETEQIYVTS